MKLNCSEKKLNSIIFFTSIIVIVILFLALFNLFGKKLFKKNIENIQIKTTEQKEDLPSNMIVCESIVQGIKDNNLPNGDYILRVPGKINGIDEVKDYNIELINYYDDVVYSLASGETSKIIEVGDSTTTYKMLVVKYHKNLTVNSGVILAARTVSGLTYKKGMYICVLGNTTNNGTITMTRRGTYNAAGENVYLWKNLDDTFEYIPNSGATGLAQITTTASGSGVQGNNGTGRQTGSGGRGGYIINNGNTGVLAKTGSGTSYSGGPGTGGVAFVGTATTSAQLGTGYTKGGDGSKHPPNIGWVFASGGAGLPQGTTYFSSKSNPNYMTGITTVSDGNGTGGLLVMYSNSVQGNGIISSNGTKASVYSSAKAAMPAAAGGSSGGGSVNVFTNSNKYNGTITATGGDWVTMPNFFASTANTVVTGGAGGNGTVNITTFSLAYPEKEMSLKKNQEYLIDNSKLKIIDNTGSKNLSIQAIDSITYQSENPEIAIVDSNGKVTGIAEGKTKIKIIDNLDGFETSIYITVINKFKSQISVGSNFTLVLREDGKIAGFGKNDLGQLGNATNADTIRPIEVCKDNSSTLLDNIIQVESGNSHSVALSKEGYVYTWGKNEYGQLGNTSEQTKNVATRIDSLTGIVKVDAYKNISSAINSDGEIYIWGEGYSAFPIKLLSSKKFVSISGEISLSDEGKIYKIDNLVSPVVELIGISKISAGNDHYLALSDSGNVYSWGINNINGELGRIATTVTTSILQDAIEISAGNDISMALKSNKELYVCGNNANGEIGLQSTPKATVMTKVNILSGIYNISGTQGTCSVISDITGKVLVTGLNTNGELGLDNNYQKVTGYTEVGNNFIMPNYENIFLDLGEQTTLELKMENMFNIKSGSSDYNQNNFSITISDSSVASLNGKTIKGETYGQTTLTVTHTVTGVTKQIPIVVVIKMESIVKGIKDCNLPNGNYDVHINGQTYKIELINYYDDVVYSLVGAETSKTIELGDSTTEYKMLIAKYHKNLTVNSGVTLTSKTVSGLSYKKGMYVCVLGTTINNGNITMTRRGTYNAAGENVYLWKNIDGSYEYVPKTGAVGVSALSTTTSGSGVKGNSGIGRQTGSGGRGGYIVNNGNTGILAPSVSGNSYSGGSGTGGVTFVGDAGTKSQSSATYAAGGDGTRDRPKTGWVFVAGGAGPVQGSTYFTSSSSDNMTGINLVSDGNGTGGLLILYSDIVEGNGSINSNGTKAPVYSSVKSNLPAAAGGSSGGGSVNIFTNSNRYKGSISAIGGDWVTMPNFFITTADTVATGGAGGDGSVTITTTALNYPVKEIQLKQNENYQIEKSIIQLVDRTMEKELSESVLNTIMYQSLNTDIAVVDSQGKITGLNEGKTKIKIINPIDNLETYIYIVVTNKIKSQLSVGKNFSLGLKENGKIIGFGKNDLGQLGNGVNINTDVPTEVYLNENTKLENIIDIGTGYSHGVGLSADGFVYTWGSNEFGQLGSLVANSRNYAEKVQGLNNILKVDAYKNITTALDSDGKVYIWGQGYSSYPIKLITNKKMVDISGDICLSQEGKIFSLFNLESPVVELVGISKISAGSDHYLALSDKGSVYSWGVNNTNGELGKSSNYITSSILNNVIDIAAGVDTSMAITANNELYVCGNNLDGTIGLEAVSKATVMTKVNSLDPIENISETEGNNSAISTNEGIVYSTGLNTYGELGLPDISKVTKFTEIGENGISSNLGKGFLDIGEEVTLEFGMENMCNVKSDSTEFEQSNFVFNIEDESKIQVEGNKIKGLNYGKTKLNVTHIPTGISRQIDLTVIIKLDSIVNGIKEKDLPNGNYDVYVNNQTYSIELINYYNDMEYSLIQGETSKIIELGDSTTENKMLIVKYHRNLIVNQGITITAKKVSNIVYKKGMYICVLGEVENNGNISMSSRGTYNVQGEDVYLWKNIDGTYEYVSKNGATGLNQISTSGTSAGIKGNSGTGRQTGSGGRGAYVIKNGNIGVLAQTGSGTSYSGGSGTGGVVYTGTAKTTTQPASGISAGGDGSTYLSGIATSFTGGGAGTLEGKTFFKSRTTDFPLPSAVSSGNGTGGLLILYGNSINGNGSITSNGSKAPVYSGLKASVEGAAAGGSSGGGSINIFANINKFTGSLSATGGESTTMPQLKFNNIAKTIPGGAGGDGNITVNILGSLLTYSDKTINLKLGDNYYIDNNKLSIVKLNEIQTSDLTLGNMLYEIENLDIAEIVNGHIVAKKQGNTRLKITDTTNNIYTYSYIKINDGVESKVAIGNNHTIALKENGTVWSFGDNTFGQLGDGTLEGKNSPVQVIKDDGTLLESIADIYSNGNSNIAVDESGNVYIWGYIVNGAESYNQQYAKHVEDLDTIVEPGVDSELLKIKKVTIYNNNFIVLNKKGDVYIFGESYDIPQKINAVSEIVEISSNKMLSRTGDVYDVFSPEIKNEYLNNIAKISAEKNHYIVLTSEGKLFCAGIGTKGELGNGTNNNSDIPVRVKDINGNYLENVIEISAGDQCSMAITSEGKVYVWGNNINKKLGITQTSVNMAIEIIKVQDKTGLLLEIPKFEKIASGLLNTVIVDENGYVYSVGIGNFGQLGTKDNNTRTVYTKIGDIEIKNTPENIVIKQDETKDISIFKSNTFNLKTDIIIDNNLIINNTNKNLIEIQKIENIDNSGVIDKNRINPNYNLTGRKIGRAVIEVSDQTSQYSKNVYVDIVGSYTAETSANVENGDGFTIALKEDGTVWSFGKNTMGQLGDGNTTNLNVPNKIIMPEIIKTISVGKNHTLALGKSGKVYSWGLNSNGQLGLGNTTNKKVPSEITGLTDIVKVKSIGNTSFAINSTGKIYAWGEGYTKIPAIISINANVIDLGKTYYLADDGKVRTIKNNTEIQLCLRQNPNPEIVEIENEKIVQISEGTDYLLLLSESGKVYSYGINVYGQLGDGSLVGKTENISTAVKTGMWTLLENIVDISAGENYSMALAADGNIYTWGINGNLQLGHEGIQENAFAIVQPNINDVIAVRAGIGHSSVITNPGNVYTFGNGENGELGNGSNDNYAIPQLVGKNIIETNKNNIILEVGETFDIDGTINYFNLYEEKVTNMEYESKDSGRILANPITGEIIGLKEGRTTVIAKEVGTEKIGVIQVRILETGSKPEGALINIEPKIVTGGKHTLSLKVDGTVWAYGQNTYGQLGIGTQETTDNPIKINFETGVKIVDIACGEEHSMALDSTGNVYVWGRNNYFQLGNSTDIFVSSPKKIESIANAIKIAAGNSNSFVITQDKNAYSWGLNANGECGIGSYTNKITVTKAKFLSDVIDIKPGKNHTIALKSTGEVFATGSNLYGELGFGEQETRKINTFRKINLLSNVVEIGTGDSHSLALNKDGKLFTWGTNIYGNLGNGQSQTQSNMPLEITGIQNIRYVTAGKGYSLLIDSANNVYVSGLNNLGQLGDGTKTDKTTFVKLTSINNVINISGGCGYTNFVKKDGTVWATGDYNQGDESLISKTKGIIPKRVGNSESGFENNEITIKINETKDIKNQFIHEFNLINVEAEVETILEYNSLNTMVATITPAKMIHGEKIGKTWVRINNTQDNKVYIIKVNVIDENYNVAPQVASGENFATVLKADGTIWSYGYNSNGELGDGTNITRDIPNRTNILVTYKKISAGKNFFVALRNDNTVWAVGDNSFGQLGQGNQISKNKLVQVPGLKNIFKVAAGKSHVIAVNKKGIIYGWGKNSNGELGENNVGRNTNSPVIIGTINERILDVAAGENQSIIVTADGKIFGYGEILNGYLDIISDVQQVQISQGYLLILTKQGSIYKYENAILNLVSENNAIEISAVENINMYQSIDEKVYVWGNNGFGQLGLNSIIDQAIPVQPQEYSNNTFAVGSGYNNSYIIENTGNVYGSGKNEYGALGNSTRNESLIHTLVGNKKYDVLPKSKIMTVNDTEILEVKVDMFNVFNKNSKDLIEFDWISSNEEVVTVIDGVLTAHSEGDATITATDKVTGETQTIERYVIPIEKQRIKSILVNDTNLDVSGQMEYSGKVVTDENSSLLKITTNDVTDQISLDGIGFTNSGIGELEIQINTIEKTIQIPVFIKISNGTVLEYLLNIEKISNNTSIDKILVNGIEASLVSLSRYEIIASENTSICVSNVIAKNQYASVSVDGKEYELGSQSKDISVDSALIKTVPISIKSENGIVEEFLLVIYKKSQVNDLEQLTVDGKSILPNGNTYEIFVPSDQQTATVYAKSMNSNYSVKIGNFEKQLAESEQIVDITNSRNEFSIKIIDDSLNEIEYILIIIKQEQDTSLKYINLSQGTFDKNIEINSNSDVYEVRIPNQYNEMVLTAITGYISSKVRVNENEFEINKTTKTISLIEDTTVIKIEVQAEDPIYKKEFTLNITKMSSNSKLKTLNINNEEVIINSEGMYYYKLQQPLNTVNIQAVTEDGLASVRLNYNEYNLNTLIKDVSIDSRINNLELFVKAEDGTTENYELVIETLSDNTNIKNVTVNGMIPEYREGQNIYEIKIDDENYNLYIELEDSLAKLIIGNELEKTGNSSVLIVKESFKTIVDVTVKAQNGIEIEKYKIVILEKSSNAEIDTIEVNNKLINPDDEGNYKAEISHAVSEVKINVIAEDENAIIVIGGITNNTYRNTIVNQIVEPVMNYEIEVIAEDGTTQIKNLEVEQQEGNTDLSGINIGLDQENMEPADLKADGTYYYKTKRTENLYIQAITESNISSVKIQTNTENIKTSTNLVNIINEINNIEVTVIAQDGTQKKYYVNVEKESNDSLIKEIKSQDILKLEKDVTDINIYVDEDKTEINLEFITNDFKAVQKLDTDIDYSGNIMNKSISLSGYTEDGIVLNLEILAEDKITTTIYKITIFKIANLKISEVKVNNQITELNEIYGLYYSVVNYTEAINIEFKSEKPEQNLYILSEDRNTVLASGVGVIQLNTIQYEQIQNYILKVESYSGGGFEENILTVRKKSQETGIEYLKVDGLGTMKETETKYTAIVSGKSDIPVEIKAIDNKAKIKIDLGSYSQNNILNSSVIVDDGQTNLFNVSVMSENGEEKVYELEITRISSNTNLESITVTDIQTNIVDGEEENIPTIQNVTMYNSSTKTYSVIVKRGNSSTRINVRSESPEAIVIIDNNSTGTQIAQLDKNLIGVGVTTVPIKIIAADSTEEVRYLEIIQLSDDTTIQLLEIDGLEISKLESDNYTAIITDENSKFNLRVKTIHSGAKIIINNTGSGIISESIVEIDKGTNRNLLIPINVIAEDGTSKLYELSINIISHNSNLQSVNINEVVQYTFNNISESFIKPDATQVNIKIQTEVEYAKIIYNETENFGTMEFTYYTNQLETQNYNILYRIVAEDGTYKDYEIRLTRESTNNLIQEVYVNEIIIDKDIDENYSLKVLDTNQSVNIELVAENIYAVVEIQGQQSTKIIEKTVDISEPVKFIEIPIKVISQSGLVNEKIVKIEKISTNKNLDNVMFESQNVTKTEGKFKQFVYENRNTVSITATAESEYAKIELLDTNQNVLAQEIHTLTHEVQTLDQINQFKIKVTAESGEFEETEIEIEKMSTDASLREIYFNGELLNKDAEDKYVAKVLDTEQTAQVRAITNNEYARVRISLGTENLNITQETVTLESQKSSVIPITVVSQSGVTEITNLYIEKISTSTNISTVKINDEESVFESEINKFSCVVDKITTQYEMFIMAESNYSIIEYDGIEYVASLRVNVDMLESLQGKSLNVKVKSESGAEKTFVIELIRESDDISLENVVVNGRIAQLEEGTTDSYPMMVKRSAQKAIIEVRTNAQYAQIRIGDELIVRNIAQSEVGINPQEERTIVPIVVTAPDGTTIKTYNVVLYKGNSNTNIIVKLNETVLTPDVDGNYTGKVKGGTSDVNIVVTSESGKASIELGGLKQLSNYTSNINLSSPLTNKVIKVISEDETEKQFNINIIKTTNIDGKIITENKNGIHKASVLVYKTENMIEPILQTETDEIGNVELEVPDGGEYCVVVTKKGYLSHKVDDVIIQNGELIILDEYELIGGDISKSGEIEISDLVKIVDYYGTVITEDNKEEKGMYDLNEDGVVNFLDRNIIKKNYGKKE